MSDLTYQWLVTTFDASVKVILLALIAFAAIFLLRIRDSNVRHRLWMVVLLAMLLLPVVSPMVPALGLPVAFEVTSNSPDTETKMGFPESSPTAGTTAPARVPPRTDDIDYGVPPSPSFVSVARPTEERRALMNPTTVQTAVSESESSETVVASGPLPGDTASVSGSIGKRWRSAIPGVRALGSWLLIAWLIGMAAMLARLAIGILLATRLVRRSTLVTKEELTAIGIDPALINARSVAVYECPCLRVPVTLGVLRTRILLPPAWITWSDAKLQSVLAHETAHARRRDTSVMVLAEINRAVYWFHPLAWWLKRQLADLAESACDDEAIDLSGDRTNYARHLLEVAAQVSSGQGRLIPIGVSMARQSNVETRIDAILDFTRPLSRRISRVAAMAIFTVAVVLIGLFAAMKPNAQADEKVADEKVADQKVAGEQVAGEQAAENAAAVADAIDAFHSANERVSTFKFAGKVVSQAGRPVEGAAIKLTYWRRDPGDADAAPLAITDRHGEFRFTRTTNDYSDSDQSDPWRYANLVATKAGYGFAAAYSVHAETTGQLVKQLTEEELAWMGSEYEDEGFSLTMLYDAPVRGRLLDTQGNPVAGATVVPISIWSGKNGSLDAWEASTRERGANFYSARRHLRQLVGGNFVLGPQATAVPEVTTDEKGWFVIEGVGRDRMVELMLRGPGIESTKVYARSRPGKTILLPRSERGTDLGSETYYPNEFSHVAGPSQPVVGRIIDSKTGAPVSGVVLRGNKIATNPIHGSSNAGFIRDTSDEQGRFRLTGFPLGENKFLVLPPAESGYLIGGARIETNSGGGDKVREIQVTKGVMLTGRVTDAVTGEPVRGHVDYWPLASNPFLQQASTFRYAGTRHIYRCDRDGRFKIPVMPGQGIVSMNADEHQKYPRAAGAESISFPSERMQSEMYNTQPSYCIPTNHHFVAPLDLKPGEQPVAMEIKLGSGDSFTGRVVSADGKPVTDFHILGSNNYSSWYPRDGDTFKVEGYIASEGRTLMAFDPDSDTIGAVDVQGKAPESIELRLAPAGRLTGRILDNEGLPVAGGIISTTPKHMRADHQLKSGSIINRLDGRPLLTDEEGRFEIRGLMPGRSYSAILSTVGMGANRSVNRLEGVLFEDVSIKAGETRDLGDVSAKPYQRDPAKIGESKPPAANDVSRDVTGEAKSDRVPNAAKGSDEAKDSPVQVTGRVRDESGQPIANARLLATHLVRWPIRSMDDIHVKEIGRTNQKGQFDVQMPEYDDVPMRLNNELYIYKDGYGASWIKLKEDDSTPNEIALAEEGLITGQILNTEGMPVAGAEINIKLLARPKAGKTMEDLIAAWKNESNIAFMNTMDTAHARLTFLSTESDDKGQFTIRGVPPGWATAVDVASEGHALSSFYVFNKNGLDASDLNKPAGNGMMSRNVPMIMGPRIVHVCEPEFAVNGRVVDDKDHPLSDVTVQALTGYNAVQIAKTDNSGHYRLGGLGRNRETLVSFHVAGRDSEFLERTIGVKSDATEAEQTVDMMLKRGIVVTGTLSELNADSAPSGSVRFVPLPGNDFSEQPGYDGYKRSRVSQTILDGKFRLVVIPGPGVLLVQASSGSRNEGKRVAYQQVNLTEDQKQKLGITGDGKDRRFTSAGNSLEFLRHQNAIACVDFEEGSGPREVDMSVSRGRSLEVKIVDADDKPVNDVFVSGVTEDWPLTAQLNEPQFTVQGLNSERPRKVLFLHADRDLAGTVTLKGDEPSPVTVKLGPAGSIRGRAIDPSGEPIADTEIQINFFHENASELYRFRGEDLVTTTTDADGRFVINHVVPGEKFNLDGRLNGETIRAQAKPEVTKRLGFDPVKGVRRLMAPEGGDHDLGDLLFGPPFGKKLPWPK